MNFPINGKKATQAVARLIQKSGGKADYLRISKLIYLADRDSIIRRGVPIVGGRYYSMRKGPTIGAVMSFVCQRNAHGWKETISERRGHTLQLLVEEPNLNTLSESEIEMLDSVVLEHQHQNIDELVKWCHQYCAEYEHVFWGRKDIAVESVLRAGGKTADKISRTLKEANAIQALDALLA